MLYVIVVAAPVLALGLLCALQAVEGRVLGQHPADPAVADTLTSAFAEAAEPEVLPPD
jgi:hypothetical protein